MIYKKNEAKIEKYVNLILHIVFLIIFIFGFTYVKFAVIIAYFILAVIKLCKKKWLQFVFEMIVIIVLYFSSGPSRYPELFYQFEQIRFYSLQNQYQMTAEKLADNGNTTEEMRREKIENSLLSSGNEVQYKKVDNSVVVLFITEYRKLSGYAWYSDDAAYSWIKEEYAKGLMEELDNNWLMIQMCR